MKKSLLWIVVSMLCVFMVAGFSLAGCKTTTTAETTAAETTAAAAETTAAATTAAETTAAEVELGVKPPEEEVKINVFGWGVFGGFKEEVIKAMVDEFNQKYPTIEFEYTIPTPADHDTLLSAAMLAGQGPDVFMSNAGGGSNGLVKYLDYALPLDSLSVEEWGENWKDKFASSPLSTAYWGTGGTDKTMGLPEFVQVYGSAGYYNKTMFDKLGLKPPSTWEELLEVAAVLKENDIPAISHSGGEGWTNVQLWFSLASDFAGDKLFQAVNGEASFTDPEFIAATEKYKEMFDNELFGSDPFTGVMYMDKIIPFYEGKYGMSLMGNWMFRASEAGELWGKQDPNTEFRIWKYPDWNGDGVAPKALVYPGVLWSINKNSSVEKQRAAFIFIKESVSGIFGQVSANAPNWMSFFGVEPDFTVLKLDQQGIDEFGYYTDALKNAAGVGLAKYTDLEEAIIDNLNQVALGKEAPADAMKAVQAVSETLERKY